MVYLFRTQQQCWTWACRWRSWSLSWRTLTFSSMTWRYSEMRSDWCSRFFFYFCLSVTASWYKSWLMRSNWIVYYISWSLVMLPEFWRNSCTVVSWKRVETQTGGAPSSHGCFHTHNQSSGSLRGCCKGPSSQAWWDFLISNKWLNNL